MQNMEQKRAAHAIGAGPTIRAGQGEGKPSAVVKKVPTLIKTNGLLATAAFAREGKDGIQSAISAIESYLKLIGMMPKQERSLLDWLAREDAAKLRIVTEEALAYLNYLRRFVPKEAR